MPTLKGWLKSAVIESNQPKESIITVLRKKLGGYEEGRKRDVVHASDITKPDFCPRHEAFLDFAGTEKGQGQFIPTALRVTFDMGKALEKVLIENWAGDTVVGNWACRRCQAQRSMCTKPKNGCGKSDDCIWEYRQTLVESPVCGVSGSPDVLFDVGVSKLLLTELKTMNATEFDAIVAPLPEHRIRTNLYLKLVAESNSPYKNLINLHEGRVFYVSRSYGKKHDGYNGEILPFKEYTVKRDDDALKPTLQRATQFKIFREQGLMPSGICATALEKTAKNCTSCQACFSGSKPSQQEPLL
jgi:hypothetical protein